jgi:ubiquinone/menaquinone biosynthesis C-methylase UbiE
MTAPATAQPSPLPIFQTINAYQRTAALKTAIELDVFTAIGERGEAGASPYDVAQRCNSHPRGTRILLDSLAVLGLLHKTDGHYSLTRDTSVFLDRRSPAYMGGALRFLLSPMLTRGFDTLTDAVRKGGTAMDAHGSTAPEHPVWVDFAEAMAALQIMPSDVLAKLVGAEKAGPCNVLDIAAGHGLFGITIAKQNPQAEIVALDWPNVLEVAKRNAEKAGLNSRFRTIAGSAFEAALGNGYDVVLLTNFLHHFDAPACESLLRKVHAALKPGGRAVMLEFIPNEDRVSPAESALFSLVMLASTPSGDAYTFAEYDRMFQNAGFARNELHALPPTFQSVVISHK